MATKQKWEDCKVPLHPKVLEIILKELGFLTMTPVQIHTMPQFLTHKDVAVEAPTGSGKTLAFVVPVFQMLLRRSDSLRKNDVGALILSPTRELAMQTANLVGLFANKLGFSCISLIGGTQMEEDEQRWRNSGGNVIIGTPGRVLYFLNAVKSVNLKELEVLILDEADRLLDMGFETSINSILQKLPKQRRTGLFSATQTKEVKELIRAGLRNPVYIKVQVENKTTSSLQKIPATLKNYYRVLPASEKLSFLVDFLTKRAGQKTVVYFLTCACVNYFWMILSQLPELKGSKLLSLHGKIPSQKRTTIYDKFRSSQASLGGGVVLLTTDVAARGLDFADIDWVVQFDLPQDPDMFVHRIGRTARMGREGSALSLLLPQEEAFLAFLEKTLEVPIQKWPASDSPPSITQRVKELVRSDRMVWKTSIVAFVAFIRAYKEHKLHYLLPFKLLPFGELATAFALLQMPRIAELRDVRITDFVPTAVDANAIPFKKPQLEQQRQQKLKAEKQQLSAAKRQHMKNDKKNTEPAEPAAPSDSDDSDSEDDFDEIMEDYRQLKKLKKRKISQREYAKRTGELDNEAEDA